MRIPRKQSDTLKRHVSTHGSAALAEWTQKNVNTCRYACQACAKGKQRCDGDGIADCSNCAHKGRPCVYRTASRPVQASTYSATLVRDNGPVEPRDVSANRSRVPTPVSVLCIPPDSTAISSGDRSGNSIQDVSQVPTSTTGLHGDADLASLQHEPFWDFELPTPRIAFPLSPLPWLGPEGDMLDFYFGNDNSVALPFHAPLISSHDSSIEGTSIAPHSTAAAPVTDTEILTLEEDDILDSEHIPQVPNITAETRTHMLRALEAELPQKEARGLANAFPSLKHLDVYVQLYFSHFHPRMPFLHAPTFQPSPEAWQLVFAVACVGCQYSAAGQKEKHIALFQRLAQHMMKKDVSTPGKDRVDILLTRSVFSSGH